MTAPTFTDTAHAQALNQQAKQHDTQAQLLRRQRNDEIRRLYEAGWSGTRLAEALGMTPRAIYNVLDDAE